MEKRPTLSIVIPTVGRPTLKRTLESIKNQEILPGDEVLVVGDGEQPEAERMFHAAGLPGMYCSTEGPARDWGARPRTEGARRSTAEYVLYMDDDDWYVAGAFACIRRALAENAGRPHMFRMRRPSKNDVLWRKPEVRLGNVSTQMFVHPNQPSRTGRWGRRYAGDLDFIRSTLAKWPPGALVWREEVIAVWTGRPRAQRGSTTDSGMGSAEE